MNKVLLLSLLLLFASRIYSQERNTTMILEWGNGGNGVYTQSLGIYGHSALIKDILYLDMGGKGIIPLKHLKKDNIITQALIGLQFSVDKKLFLGIRGGYGWMYGNNKDLKGATFEPSARIKLTKHLFCGYSFNYQYLGKIFDVRVHSNTHEGKLIYLL